MSFQPGAMNYTQGFGSRPENVEVPHIDVRDPTSTDVLYPLGKRWLNKTTGSEFILGNFSTLQGITSANWYQLANTSSSPSFSGTVTAGTGFVSTNGNLTLGTAGNKLNIATGSNASVGTSAAMTAGAITINTTAVTANSIIFVSANTLAGTPGTLSAPAASRVAGTSFGIASSSNTDTSTVNWWIIN